MKILATTVPPMIQGITVLSKIQLPVLPDSAQRLLILSSAGNDGIDKRTIRSWPISLHIEARQEVWRMSGDDSDPKGTPIVACYTKDNSYVGDLKFAKYLAGHCIHPERKTVESTVCSIGYSPPKKAWAGWSHRALCFFEIGDRVFEEAYMGEEGDSIPYKLHGSTTIETLEQSKAAAIAFADSVS